MRISRLSYNARLLVVTIVAAIVLLPVVFTMVNSFMSASEAQARYFAEITPQNIHGFTVGNIHYVEMTLMPDVVSLSAYRQILLEDPTHLRFFWNSVILVVPIVVGQLVIAPLAAYGFEQARSKHKEKLFFAYVITMLMPLQALIVPHFITARFFGIDRGYLPIILPAAFGAFGVFLIRQQMRGFEKGMIEAARIDGASEITIFLKIVLPNIKPTIAALTVLAFSEAWNIIDQAVVFIRDFFQMPMATYLTVGFTGNLGIVFALSSLFMIPALIVFICGQDHLQTSLDYRGVK